MRSCFPSMPMPGPAVPEPGRCRRPVRMDSQPEDAPGVPDGPACGTTRSARHVAGKGRRRRNAVQHLRRRYTWMLPVSDRSHETLSPASAALDDFALALRSGSGCLPGLMLRPEVGMPEGGRTDSAERCGHPVLGCKQEVGRNRILETQYALRSVSLPDEGRQFPEPPVAGPGLVRRQAPHLPGIVQAPQAGQPIPQPAPTMIILTGSRIWDARRWQGRYHRARKSRACQPGLAPAGGKPPAYGRVRLLRAAAACSHQARRALAKGQPANSVPRFPARPGIKVKHQDR